MKPEKCAAALGAPLIFPAAVEQGEPLGPGSCRHRGVKALGRGEGLRAGTAGCSPQLRGTAERAGWVQELGGVLLSMLLPPAPCPLGAPSRGRGWGTGGCCPSSQQRSARRQGWCLRGVQGLFCHSPAWPQERGSSLRISLHCRNSCCVIFLSRRSATVFSSRLFIAQTPQGFQ